MNPPTGEKLHHRVWHTVRGHGTTWLVDTVRENVTTWLVVGLIIAATGAAPEDWFHRALRSVHISGDALHLWGAHVDLRVAIVFAGIAIIVGNVLWRHHGQRPAVPEGGSPLAPADVQPAANAGPGDGPALTLPNKPSIAVLPFRNLSGDPDQEIFADGMVEEIVTALSRVRWLFVIARNTTATYKDRAVDVKQVAAELGVRYVLEGSVRRSGNRVRVSAQLVDMAAGHHVWAERYERELTDIFVMQDEITDSVMTAIEPRLYAVEGTRATRKPPESLDAWECVVRSISLMSARTKPDAETARQLLEKAIVLDPGYAYAHSMLAFLLALGVHSGWYPRDTTLSVAWDTAQCSLALDPDEPWTHAALGFVLVLSRRVADGAREYENAINLNPNFAYGYTMLGAALCYLGRGEEALAMLDAAERLSPRDLLTRGNRGATYVARAAACMVAARYSAGIVFARTAIVENPSSTPAARELVINLALAGEIDEAKSALGIVKRLQPDISLKWIEDWSPFVRAEDTRKYVEGFRLAGLE